MSETEAVEDVTWNIDTLVENPTKEGIADVFEEGEGLATRIEAYRGTIGTLNVDELTQFFGLVSEFTSLVGRCGNYAMLNFSTKTDDPQAGALMAFVQEQATALASRLIFVELELAEIPDEQADRLIADPKLSNVAHHLAEIRKFRPFLLSEPEEIILTEKSVTGDSAWSRLFDELTSAIEVDLNTSGTTSDDSDEPVSLDAALSMLSSPSADDRSDAASAITTSLADGLKTRAYIFNTLLADKSTDDRLRGHSSWIDTRNLANEASNASVEALIEAVVGRYELPQRWYSLKARLLGVDKLNYWDRMAPVVSDDTAVSWSEGKQIVLDAYGSFSPELANIANEFFDNQWIDAPMRPSKRGGAFCAYTVPEHHPYVLLNWTNKRRDVLTLAHELGHGMHAYLSRPQGVFHHSTPLTLAETASVFGETVTFGAILEPITNPAERLPLLAEHLEDQIATVFRQIAMNRFEDSVHNERRNVGELSTDRFGELWLDSQRDMLGDSVSLEGGYDTWWSYIPHFIHTPGYVYAYAYGQLLALSIYAQYEKQGAAFVPKYLELLSAGGSMAPVDLGNLVGVDLADPRFWDAGLDIIAGLVDETEQAAEQAGRLS